MVTSTCGGTDSTASFRDLEETIEMLRYIPQSLAESAEGKSLIDDSFLAFEIFLKRNLDTAKGSPEHKQAEKIVAKLQALGSNPGYAANCKAFSDPEKSLMAELLESKPSSFNAPYGIALDLARNLESTADPDLQKIIIGVCGSVIADRELASRLELPAADTAVFRLYIADSLTVFACIKTQPDSLRREALVHVGNLLLEDLSAEKGETNMILGRIRAYREAGSAAEKSPLTDRIMLDIETALAPKFPGTVSPPAYAAAVRHRLHLVPGIG